MTLKVDNLSCVRGERLVFAGLSFTLEPGRVLTVRGANGAGKSSLLRLLAGLARAAAGSITWEGHAVGEATDAPAYVGHLDAVKPTLTVLENVAFWRAFHGGQRSAEAALEALGIGRLADLPARYLSAGQRRRTALARLIVQNARLWLLDEPTVGLDDDGVARLSSVVREHLAAGGIAVASTHLPLPFGDGAVLDLPSPGR
jgi:heme exporter protein A